MNNNRYIKIIAILLNFVLIFEQTVLSFSNENTFKLATKSIFTKKDQKEILDYVVVELSQINKKLKGENSKLAKELLKLLEIEQKTKNKSVKRLMQKRITALENSLTKESRKAFIKVLHKKKNEITIRNLKIYLRKKGDEYNLKKMYLEKGLEFVVYFLIIEAIGLYLVPMFVTKIFGPALGHIVRFTPWQYPLLLFYPIVIRQFNRWYFHIKSFFKPHNLPGVDHMSQTLAEEFEIDEKIGIYTDVKEAMSLIGKFITQPHLSKKEKKKLLTQALVDLGWMYEHHPFALKKKIKKLSKKSA